MFSEKRGNVLHGVLLIALFSCSAFYIAEFQFIKQLSFSPLIVGIIYRYVVRQQPEKPFAGDVGSGYPVLY